MSNKKLQQLYQNSNELLPRAELKEEILSRAKQELALKKLDSAKEKSATKPFKRKKRWLPLAACCAFILIVIGSLFGLYHQNYQTVYVDVNPSVSLEVNRFGTVNSVNYINEDAKDALDGVKLTGRQAEDALELMLNAYNEVGYFDKEADVCISAVEEKGKDADKLLKKLQKRAEKIRGNKKYSVTVLKLTKADKAQAKENGISPGKYRIISEIIAIDPSYTVDDLKDKTMQELKNILKGK